MCVRERERETERGRERDREREREGEWCVSGWVRGTDDVILFYFVQLYVVSFYLYICFLLVFFSNILSEFTL